MQLFTLQKYKSCTLGARTMLKREIFFKESLQVKMLIPSYLVTGFV